MKLLLRWLLKALGWMLLSMEPASAAAGLVEVQVEIYGLRSAAGRVLVALHDDRWAFPSRWDRAVAAAEVPAAAGAVSVTMRLPRAGRFALIVVHDEDGNGRMNKSTLGLPREGCATGRDAPTLEFPLFEPALRQWEAGTRVGVRVLYP